MKPGIYALPDREYFAAPGINSSGLKKIERSPAHFKYELDHPRDPTPNMLAGTALHAAILEPDQFMRRYAILPDNAPLRPTENMLAQKEPKPDILERIQFWRKFDIESTGRTVINNDQAAQYLHIGGLVRNHPELAVLFNVGKAEQAVFATDPVRGVLCKCKPDYLTQVGDLKVMLELKSTDDARPAAFQRIAMNFGYFTSAAFYCDQMEWAGVGRPDVYLIVAVERDPPYGMMIYEVPPEAMEYGQRHYRQALDLYAYCLEQDYWPNYDTTITPLNLPTWAKE